MDRKAAKSRNCITINFSGRKREALMAKQKENKTNAMRILESLKIPFEHYTYECDEFVDAIQIADMLNLPYEKVYKTLVTVGKTGEHYVFMVPVSAELDLKKGAKAVGEKSVEMIKSKELLPLTGYIHGGCSPIGMKKFFKTKFTILKFIHLL